MFALARLNEFDGSSEAVVDIGHARPRAKQRTERHGAWKVTVDEIGRSGDSRPVARYLRDVEPSSWRGWAIGVADAWLISVVSW